MYIQATSKRLFINKLRARLEQSMDYFSPIKDREQASTRKDRLGVKIGEIASVKGHFTEVDKLKTELLRLKKLELVCR